MSLINEALKKAQRQRSLDNAPLSSAPSGVAAAAVTTHVRAASHKRSHGTLWFALGLVAAGAGTTVLIMRYGVSSAAPANSVAIAPVAQPASASPVITPVPAPTPIRPAVNQEETAPPMVVMPPIPSATKAQSAPTSATPPVAATSTPTKPPAPASADSAPPIAPAPATTQAIAPAPAPSTALVSKTVPEAVSTVSAVAAPAAAPSPAEREAQVYSFLNTLRITGVRGVDRDARVLMNERVWRLNDVVSAELGLRLSAVRPNMLVFTDAQGRTYEKLYR